MSGFYTDFSTGTIADWTSRFDTTLFTASYEVDAGAPGGKVMRVVAGASRATFGLSRNSLDGVADVIHLARVKKATLATNDEVNLFTRGSGTSAAGYHYRGGVYNNAGTITTRISRQVGGTSEAIAGTGVAIPGIPVTDADLWIKFYCIGSALKLKVWNNSEAEPAAWTVETTDTGVVTGGWNGTISRTTPTGPVVEFATFSMNYDEASIAATSAGDIAAIGLAGPMDVTVAATAGGDTSALSLQQSEVTIAVTTGNDSADLPLFHYQTGDFDVEVPQVESAFDGVENTFFDFQESFPISVSFTGEDLQIATFDVEVPLIEASFTSPYGETLNIVLPMLESVFSESDQGYAEFSTTIPMLFSSFVGGELLTASFDVVCVNARTKAHSTYTNFPFNSFARFNGVDLACSATGIHALGGDTDASSAINAELYFGLSDFGTANQKRIDSVWVRTRLTEELDVKIKYDETVETVDRVNTHGATGIQTVRARGGRGDQGNFVQVGVANVDGSDFELLDMEADVITLSRR